MRSESYVERYSFTCVHCRHHWSAEYEVRHVEDGHGHEHDYYSRDGLPVVTPTAPGGPCCPQCGAHWVSPAIQGLRTTRA